MGSRAHILATLLASSLVGGGCSPGDAPEAMPSQSLSSRSASLVTTLTEDNTVWTDRDPQLLAQKYDKMARDLYDYMRGSAGVYIADAAQPGSLLDRSAYLQTGEAWAVMVAGDPHPENIGSFLGEALPPVGAVPQGYPHLELNDLDGAGYGPYLLDLRRANLGLLTLIDAFPDLPESAKPMVATALSRAYADEILTPLNAEEGIDPLEAGVGGDVGDALLAEAFEEGYERKRLEKHTVMDEGGARRLERSAINDKGKGALDLTPEEYAEVQGLMTGLPGVRLLDGVRRFGTGVQSLPARRYRLLVDGGLDGPEDDRLLNVREVVDPPAALTQLTQPEGDPFESNADRLAETTLNLWYQPDADPEFLTLEESGTSFKVLSWDSYYQSFDHDDLRDDWKDGKLTQGDLLDFAEGIGRLLAGAHGRAPSAHGNQALAVIAEDIRHGCGHDDPGLCVDAFAKEQSGVAVVELEALKVDYGLFRSALTDLGPVLGAEALFDSSP